MVTFNENVQDKITTWFKDNLGLKDYRRGWLKGDCPYCGKVNKFGINPEQNRSNCFSCGNHGNLLKVIIDVNDGVLTYRQVLDMLAKVDNDSYIKFKRPKKEETQHKAISLPEGFTLLSFGTNEISKMARNYMRGRGFSVNTLSMRGIGYCGSGEYRGCIIIPYYQDGKLIYFTGRRFINLYGEEKFKNPKEEDVGVGKLGIIYNIDALKVYSKIRVVESAINALTLPDNVIGLSGKSISSHQLSDIIRSHVKRVSLLLDPDAVKETYKLAMALSEYKKVKVTILPDNKDVNDLGRKQTIMIERESKYGSYNYFKNKLINL